MFMLISAECPTLATTKDKDDPRFPAISLELGGCWNRQIR
jgi:hypothetical protein